MLEIFAFPFLKLIIVILKLQEAVHVYRNEIIEKCQNSHVFRGGVLA